MAQPSFSIAQRDPRADGQSIAVADDRGGKLLEDLRQSLRPLDAGKWSAGWQLAMEFGTAALPVLERIWNEERNPKGRYAILCAIALASGDATDAFLMERLGRDGEARQQFLTLACLAMGPERPADDERHALFARLLHESTNKPVLRIATLLAARRYSFVPDTALYADTNPGIAAAVRMCRARIDDMGLERWLTPASDRSFAALVERGAMLGVESPAALAPALEDRALQALSGIGALDPVSAAAAVCGVRALDVAASAARLDLDALRTEVITILAVAPRWRDRLAASPLRRAVGAPLMAPEFRVRAGVALAHALGVVGLREVVADLSNQPDIENAFALTLAMRCFASTGQLQDVAPPKCSAAEWVALARGNAVPEEPSFLGDRALQRSFGFARAGALPAPAAAAAIDAAQWRLGWHPARSVFEIELDMIRDLLIAGSDSGLAHAAIEDRASVYFPRGLPPGDEVFDVARQFCAFVRSSTPSMPRRLQPR